MATRKHPFHSTEPCWSFSSRHRSSVSEVPGPGAYNIPSRAVNRTSAKIGTGPSRNLSLPSEFVPGPGSYNKKSTITETAYSIGFRHDKVKS